MGTLMRCIQCRMHVLQTDDVVVQTERQRRLLHEAAQLFRRTFISVTRFFRNRDAQRAGK